MGLLSEASRGHQVAAAEEELRHHQPGVKPRMRYASQDCDAQVRLLLQRIRRMRAARMAPAAYDVMASRYT